LPIFELYRTTGRAFEAFSDLRIKNNLYMDTSGVNLKMLGNSLTLERDFTLPAGDSLTMREGALRFYGSSSQTFACNGVLNNGLANLEIDNPDTFYFSGSVDTIGVGGNFSLLQGTLSNGGKTIYVNKDLTISGTHIGLGRLHLRGGLSRNLYGNGEGVLGKVIFDGTGDVQVNAQTSFILSDSFVFTGTGKRLVNMGNYGVTLKTTARIGGANSSRFFLFSGSPLAKGMT